MTARLKGRQEIVVRTGWWAGFIGRVKNVQTPDHWLASTRGKKTSGAAGVLALFKRMAAKRAKS